MIDLLELKTYINENPNENCYIFTGYDEQIIKDSIKKITNNIVNENFKELNYITFDGNSLEEFDDIFNACETVPFMSEKKVVVIYRASFLEDDKNDYKSKNLYNKMEKYIEKMPDYCTLIMYSVLNNKRDKISSRIKKLDKKSCVVQVDKLKGNNLEKIIEKLFINKGKKIDKVCLKVFAQNMKEENLSIIENEVQKICDYTLGKDIEKKDINEMYQNISDEDIFDLMNFISQRKTREAIEVFNELLFKGHKVNHILAMIEKQFRNLYLVKAGIDNNKTKDELSRELKIHPYGCSILISQSKKFTLKQIEKAIGMSLEVDKKIKTTSVNPNTEVELLIINSISY
ncbi:DNA polymerase III subunit delta [Clostridium niameyense]|uniref:DNA polymerase III subunit delta n=1 Tax=Clostridium niameyense TaxID=1622073 RepID=A0A6M0R643_9CLOT|nr:DNA polymerase III subunit delta [Clostridium niameyense]NEZ45692.1 DNA polymerase III subunit delta [Clostridium niameyense]